MALLKEGYAPVEVAQRVGVDRRSVRRWKAAYRRGGEGSLRAKPASGRPLKLSGAGRRRLERVLLKGAKASGFPTDLWTCRRIAQVVRERFGVSYHCAHVSRLLRLLGWSAQRPERRAVERDEEAIGRWIKEDWPRIKKKPIA
jgi:transposase